MKINRHNQTTISISKETKAKLKKLRDLSDFENYDDLINSTIDETIRACGLILE